MTQREYKRHIQEVEEAIIDIAKSPQGKFFLRWLLDEECDIFNTALLRDREISIWKEAKRDTGLKVFKTVRSAGLYDIINVVKKETDKVSEEKE